MSFYAVARGRAPGIYRTWPECQAQVQGFPRAAFKKFPSLDAANEFIRNNTEVAPKRPLAPVVVLDGDDDDDDDDDDGGGDGAHAAKKRAVAAKRIVRVFTDGAAKGNGTSSCVAGSACWFEGVHVPQQLQLRTPGAQTNSRAELFGAAVALNASLDDDIVEVCTDSDYLVRGVAELKTYVCNGWRLSREKPLANADLWQLLSALLEARVARGHERATFTHVAAHSGIAGNERADELSVAATALRPQTASELAAHFAGVSHNWQQTQT